MAVPSRAIQLGDFDGFRHASGRSLPCGTNAREDKRNGPKGMLDFNQAMTRLVAEVAANVREFHTIDPQQVLVSAAFSRKARRAGLLAYVLPLKYREGSPVDRRVRGQKVYHWAMLPTFHRETGKEVLYIVYFMLPRFYNLGLKEKLETVVHELYHISPKFNGDLRWFKGRSALHGDMKSYDKKVKELTDEFLNSPHDAGAYEFLKGSFSQSEKKFERILARHIREPRPKLLKVANLNPWSPYPGADFNPWRSGLPTSAS
jgi:hypothetical protein